MVRNSDGNVSRGEAALERLALERIERIASRSKARRVLARALETAGASRVPPEPRGFSLFVRGALHEAMVSLLGQDAADELGAELERLAVGPAPAEGDATASSPSPVDRSGVRGRRRKRRGGGDDEHGSGTRARPARMVIVASTDPTRGGWVADALTDRVNARCSSDVFELLQIAEQHLDRALVLLLDRGLPGLRGPMLATLARILPPTAEVIFWGAPPPTSSVDLAVEVLPDETPREAVLERCLGPVEEAPVDEGPDVILIADDDAVWRTTLERRLRHEGYGVVSVGDGFAALEAAIDHEPALVLSDYDMPTLNGQQLAALLRGRFGDACPPVILITSSEVSATGPIVRVMDKAVAFEAILDEVRRHFEVRDAATAV